ncbi:uncharacterized protein B0P05DRAFT_524960 [Gilbertella persicaria]|uniref:Uncharacterized protein n=1 Tax=Rhizopus stolonifer TaxID=4846 RepID=A0A367KLV4_RHIST|nr:uncharacterized protein B0P05DRAFT_524960 [Gilbertella persicaria]KAI8092151.1 hypothetical protein B0P05DRAFT_524960 [Gilbertella persicaria]RCI03214.1 hypothetical protein CU098_008133 [Rhizopus stolonifer]
MPQKVPEEEMPVLERLLNLRARLSAVKRNRSSYLRLEEIMPLRFEVEAEMKVLSDLRNGRLLDESRELNRTDDVLDEILQMLSLCFLSLGKTRETPAVYSQVVAIQHIFDRLEEVGVYEEEFLKPYKVKLDEIEKILSVDSKNKALPEHVMQVLQYKFRQCKNIYNKLLETIHELAPELVPIRDKMLHIRRHLASICTRGGYLPSDIKPLQEKIRAVDSLRVDGKFMGEDGVSIPPGQGVLVNLLEQLYYWSHDLIIACSDDFSPALQSIRERLLEIKNQLERLELTHKWTLRQTDLFTYQHQLHDIVKMRHTECNENGEETEVDPELYGRFLDENGQAPEGQTVLEFLLHKCYRMIFVLLSESVPVSEALTPVYNQLTTVRQCLLAVQKTGAPCSAEELYPYQMKLASIEDLRKDGKFYDDNGDIPEGQALCVDVLEECYSILDSLRENSEEDEIAKSEDI